MEKDIRKVFGKDISRAIEDIVRCYEDIDFTSEQLAEHMENIDEILREAIHITALSEGNQELAERINAANEIIKQNQINNFKKSVVEGTYEEFLSKMSWTDKSSFLVNMGLFRIGFSSEKPYTAEEQQYYDIIKSSIDKDIEKEALSKGFPSVEAWEENRSKVLKKQRSNFNGRKF